MSIKIEEFNRQNYDQYFKYIDDMYENSDGYIDDQDIAESMKSEFHLTDEQIEDIFGEYIDNSYHNKKKESYIIEEVSDDEFLDPDDEAEDNNDSGDDELNLDTTRN